MANTISKFYITKNDDYCTGFVDGSIHTIIDIQGHLAREDFAETENPILNDLLSDMEWHLTTSVDSEKHEMLKDSYLKLAKYIGNINTALGLPRVFDIKEGQLYINIKENKEALETFTKAKVSDLPGYIKFLRKKYNW